MGILLSNSVVTIMPELLLALSALVMLLIGAFKGDGFTLNQIVLAKFVLLATIFLVLIEPADSQFAFSGMFIANSFTSFAKVVVLVGAILALYLSLGYYRDNKLNRRPEFAVLVMLATLGMLLMISANNFLALYMGLELQSLALYVLAAIHRNREKSSEAGLKYFVLGAISSGMVLYGISMIYGFSGSIDFDILKGLYINDGGQLPIGVLTGVIFVIAGLCFKVSAVPFHMWTPDVYQGSPMPVTAFFAIAPKVAAMALFVRMLMHPFAGAVDQWQQVIIFVAAASMIIGALGALMQTNIKRLLAYSSIGHMGYVLVGLAAANSEGIRGILLYLVIYVSLSAGMFACVMMICKKGDKSQNISSFSGLAKSRPYLALMIAVLMFSMAGIPPFAGFFGKFFIFLAAVKAGLYPLAVIGVLSSVIAAYYYLRIIKIMYFDESSVNLDKSTQPEMRLVAITAALFNILFFIGFTPLLQSAQRAAGFLF